MKSEIEMPAAPKLWQNLAIVILALSILRGIRYPNMWSYTHFLFNYDLGFVKRGLIGEIVSHIGNPFFSTYTFFVIFSLVLFSINMILIGTLIHDLVSSRKPILIGGTFVFVSSLAVVFLSHTIGYLDHLGLLITLITIKINQFNKKLLFLSLTLPFALLIHEAILILLFPVIFVSLFLSIPEENRLQKLMLLTLFSAVILGLVFTISQFTLEKSEADQMYTTLQAINENPLRKDAFNVLHRDSAENFERTMERWAGDLLKDLWKSILVTAPNVLLLVYMTIVIMKHASAPKFAIVLAVLASLSPLLLHLFGWDMHRWNTYAITTSFLMFFTAHKLSDQPIKIAAPIYFLIILLVIVNGISTIPLFDGYYVKQFPFIEHQNYILDLIKGVEVFPYVPPR